MNPEQPIAVVAKEARYIRTIITVGLVLILLAIVSAYIYYGMQFAQKNDPASMVEETEEVAPGTSREDILTALENAPVASPEETEAVLEALEATEPVPSANREDILRALNYPTE